jgi:pilus assembly protein CpaE
MPQLSLIIYSERPEFVKKLESTFAKVESAKIIAIANDLESLERFSKKKDADGLIVDLLPGPDYVLDEIENISTLPSALFMVGPQEQSDIILRAMRLGAREFFTDPPSAEALEQAFRASLGTVAKPTNSTSEARVVGVIGAKGGVGATTVACQLGFALQAMGKRTAIVDLNLPLGDVALHCDITPAHTLANMASDRSNTDATFVKKLLQKHESGLQIMASPNRIEEAETISIQHIGTAIRLMREEFDWIVLDISRSWNEVSTYALDSSDIVMAVSVIDLPALGHLKQHLALMERLGHTKNNVRLVANRYDKHKGSLDRKDFADFIGRKFDFEISNDFSTVAAAIDAGCPTSKISSRAAVTREFEALARELHVWCGLESDSPQTSTARKGLRKLFRR